MTDRTPRMRSPAAIFPEMTEILQSYVRLAENRGLPPGLLATAMLRVSQINGCSVCIDGHARNLKRTGEPVEHAMAVSAWRDAPYFTSAERAALALAESVTRLADSTDPVPDPIWEAAAREFDETQLAALLVGITAMNTFNRLNVATRQLAGRQPWEPRDEAAAAPEGRPTALPTTTARA